MSQKDIQNLFRAISEARLEIVKATASFQTVMARIEAKQSIHDNKVEILEKKVNLLQNVLATLVGVILSGSVSVAVAKYTFNLF